MHVPEDAWPTIAAAVAGFFGVLGTVLGALFKGRDSRRVNVRNREVIADVIQTEMRPMRAELAMARDEIADARKESARAVHAAAQARAEVLALPCRDGDPCPLSATGTGG